MYSMKKCRKLNEKHKSHKRNLLLKRKSKKKKTKDAHFSYDSKSDSNEEIKVDFNEELHSISYYVKDRAEMINQMFKVIQGKKLAAMLPPLLKDTGMNLELHPTDSLSSHIASPTDVTTLNQTTANTLGIQLKKGMNAFETYVLVISMLSEGYSVDELKSLCLEELLGMSEKRIMSVLEGQELESSSESDVHSSELETEEKFAEENHNRSWCSDAEISSTTKTGDNDNDGTNDVGDMDTLEIGITREEMGELLNDMSFGETSQKKQPKEKQCEKTFKCNKFETIDSIQSKRKPFEEQTSKLIFTHTQEQEIEEDGTEKEDKSKGKTLLEILELEMRARAIRALLKQQGEEEGDIEFETKRHKQSNAVTPDVDQQNADVIIMNVDKKNTGAVTANTAVKEMSSVNIREKSLNSTTKEGGRNPQPRKKFKKMSEHVKKSTNTFLISGTNNDKIEMDLVTTKIEFVDLTKEKLDAKEVTSGASGPFKGVHDNQNEETSRNGDKTCTTSKTVELQDKTFCKDIMLTTENRTALDRAKRRCYRSNQEEGEISSDDENKSDAAHIVKIESESDFDVITLDDSNDSICSFPRAERRVTIEKSNTGKHTFESDATNQRMYSEILRSNIKVYVKNKGKLKSRDIQLDSLSSSWSKNPKMQIQKVSEENRDEGQNTEIESEDVASDMIRAAHWLKSKGVQKVVKTSKVCAKMRKRMKNAQKRPQATLQDTREQSKSPVHIVGSVKEYRMLDKPKALQSDSKQRLCEDK